MKTALSLKTSLLTAFLLMLAFPVMAQNFFIAPRADFSFYGRNEPTIGGGLCFGYDGSEITSFGLNAVYIFPLGSQDDKRINGVEITVFIR